MLTTKYDTVADPKYLDWSKHPITFSRADQWADILYPRHFPLVLYPIISNMRFKKVLIDDGSALNIPFARALTKKGLMKDDLIPIDCPFWGIVPGRASQPLGPVTLPIQFGTADHFRTKYVNSSWQTSTPLTKPSLADQLWPSSWPCPIMSIWC